MTQSPSLAALRRQGRLFAVIAVIAMLAIVGVMGLTILVIVQHWTDMAGHTLLHLALVWSPTPCYLAALASLRGMFRAFAREGARFQPVLAGGLVRTGWALLLGALTALLTSPFIFAMEPHRGIAGRFATFNIPALTLGIVGLAVVATAQMVRRGIEIEAEAASLKAELGEFV